MLQFNAGRVERPIDVLERAVATDAAVSTGGIAAGDRPPVRGRVVFLTKGLNKFVSPGERGPGRFDGLGFPAPEFVANAIGVVELVAGSMLLLGFLTRFAAIFLLGVALNAIVLTELLVLLGALIGPFTGVDAALRMQRATMWASRASPPESGLPA